MSEASYKNREYAQNVRNAHDYMERSGFWVYWERRQFLDSDSKEYHDNIRRVKSILSRAKSFKRGKVGDC